MRPRKPRVLPRLYFYLFLIVLVVGLMAGAIASSAARKRKPASKVSAPVAAFGNREEQYFFVAKPATSSPDLEQPASAAAGQPYHQDSAARVRKLQQLIIQNPASKIAPQVLADTAGGKSTSVVILLADQADVSAAYAMKDQDARGWYVFKALTQHAARTQLGLQSFLKAQGVEYQSFWAANMLIATANQQLIGLLAERLDVARVDSNRPARWIEDPSIEKMSLAPEAPNAVEWGVMNVNAPAVWAMGFTGTGIVVGDLDTGMRWTHNALKPAYRGWNGSSADHNFNWHDAIHSGGGICGANTVAPCDDSGHGSHTAGTMVGNDGAGNQIGVAPGAKWIGCRNMDQGNGTPATYSECFQFAIAPTDLAGNNANPALRPHVLNNSWVCPVSEGCTTGAELETIVNNTQAAGIFVEVSAGNSGPGCSTVADAPALYSASFSTGAIDINNNLASFSSRGPSTFYSPALLKPNISAPGVGVRSSSSASDTTFANLSGTSMAGPHVVGVVALLWSARPSLARNIAATKTILQNSANPAVTVSPETCGGTPSSQIPNNSFGYGRVDALAAVNSTPTAAPAKISGQILSSGQPVGGVTITVSGGPQVIRALTDSLGSYNVDGLAVGVVYTVVPTRANYSFSPTNRLISLIADKTDAVFTGEALTPRENPLDSPEFFVRQQYLDFLDREPEQAGLDYWSGKLRSCGSDLNCVNTQRVGISAAFFIEQEFQLTGSYVYEVYAGTIGRKPAFIEYSSDRRQVVGGTNLDAAKLAFAQNFVQRSEFTTKYQANTTAATFVEALVQNLLAAGTDLTGDRANLIIIYNNAGNMVDSRAAVVQTIADNATFKQSQYNQAFVLSEYFAYLHRDAEPAGYNFWLNVLNISDPGNYSGMVCSFVTAAEYQNRFSSVVSHNNGECAAQ